MPSRGPSVFSPGPSELRSDNGDHEESPEQATQQGGKPHRNSDRSNAITRSQTRSLRGLQKITSTAINNTQRRPDNKFNQCFSCHQGGDIVVCSKCFGQAFCCSRGSQIRCLPEWAFYAKDFRCPKCHWAHGTTVNYRVPLYGPSRGGRDTSPLVFYGVFYDDSILARAAMNLLEGQVRGYFSGKENELLALTSPFSNFDALTSELQLNINHIQQFIRFRKARFVLVLQTHADPKTGELYKGMDEYSRLGDLLADILGDIPLSQFSRSLLFVNSCGGFIKHHANDLTAAATSLGFSTTLGFTGQAVDPLMVSRTVLYDVIDHHLVGNTAIRTVLSYAANFHLLQHTSVLACSSRESSLLCGATIRHQPNGVRIRCPQCGQTPRHFKTEDDHLTVIYRCPGPHSPRKFEVKLITNDENITVHGEPGNSSRHMIRTHEHIGDLIAFMDVDLE